MTMPSHDAGQTQRGDLYANITIFRLCRFNNAPSALILKNAGESSIFFSFSYGVGIVFFFFYAVSFDSKRNKIRLLLIARKPKILFAMVEMSFPAAGVLDGAQGPLKNFMLQQLKTILFLWRILLLFILRCEMIFVF